MPVLEQTAAYGHAVRAVYLYCGMTDIAAITGDSRYINALDAIWKNCTGRKTYLTGGIGSRRPLFLYKSARIKRNDTV
jgi:uncharacterized protein